MEAAPGLIKECIVCLKGRQLEATYNSLCFVFKLVFLGQGS